MRADQLLVARHLASSRSQAQRLIANGLQWRQGEEWKTVVKNGDEIPSDAQLKLIDDSEARYVSRGGLKLEAALKKLDLSVKGFACLDVGQSTGGFTDCLLQHGAVSVVGVDVGSAQLHSRLRADPRVLCVEKVNARSLVAADLQDAYVRSTGVAGQFDADADKTFEFVPAFDLIVADLSFISQTLVLPAIVPFLKSGGTLLTLVKPQFELQPGQVGKGGIVKNASFYPLIEQRLREACADLGLTVEAWFESPIAGGDGNREFFICSCKRDAPLRA
jgi:23S rRNA (cytidine1920-2'-O)/16S rRNA (cytidine1409-2'-O)-methyltransferase